MIELPKRCGLRPWVLAVLLSCAACAAALAAEPPAGMPPGTVLAGPYLVGFAPDSLIVRWESPAGCDGAAVLQPGSAKEVRVAAVPAKGQGRHEKLTTAICDAPLPSLEPCREYAYRIVTAGTARVVTSFVAPPRPGQSCPGGLRLAIIGDTRSGHEKHAALVGQMRAFKPHLVVHLGDLVCHADRVEEWRTFFNIERRVLASAPVVVVPGNHDVWTNQKLDHFGAFMMKRYFRVGERGGIKHFTFEFGPFSGVVLDTYFGEQLDNGGMTWLKKRLAGIPDDRIKLVAIHEPPITFGTHMPGEELHYLRRVLVRNKVSLVLAGHVHLYERFVIGTTHFINSGGGGAYLHKARENVVSDEAQYLRKAVADFEFVTLELKDQVMHMRALDRQGKVIDEWSVDHPGNPPEQP